MNNCGPCEDPMVLSGVEILACVRGSGYVPICATYRILWHGLCSVLFPMIHATFEPGLPTLYPKVVHAHTHTQHILLLHSAECVPWVVDTH